MAKKKLVPTWLKVAAVAALFAPYKVKVDKDENQKIKRITANSVAVKLSCSLAEGGRVSDVDLIIPGVATDKCKVKAGGKTYTVNGEQIVENAKQVYGEVAGKVKEFAKKAADGVASIKERKAESDDEDEELFDLFADEEEGVGEETVEVVLNEEETEDEAPKEEAPLAE